MGDVTTPHGFLSFAAGNRAAQPQVDNTIDKSTQRQNTHKSGTIAADEQNHFCPRAHLPTNLQLPRHHNNEKMFSFQPVPLIKRGSARSRSRQNRIAATRANVGVETWQSDCR